MAMVSFARGDGSWAMKVRSETVPYPSSDPDTAHIWWRKFGVHQNLTFPVHPDPISGMHCWDQAVTVTLAQSGDAPGDVVVDSARSHAAYLQWLALTPPGAGGLRAADGAHRG